MARETTTPPTGPGRDRLRELLDAVLAEEHGTLAEMAGGAFASPFHFSRTLTGSTGEPPVTMRRRVMLERAAWQLRQGSSVTDAAFAAGYESVEGFSRAFSRAYGEQPSAVRAGTGAATGGHWLPAPNGIHFHPPTSLWVESGEGSSPVRAGAGQVTALMVEHDLDDTRDLLEAAKGLAEEEWRRPRLPGLEPLPFDGPERSLADVLGHLVATKEVWLASVTGRDQPPAGDDDPVSLLARHHDVAPAWLAMVRDVDRRDAWGDRLVDALCDPPESFVLGGVLAHVLTYSAHRRVLARALLADRVPDAAWPAGDPLTWLHRRHEEDPA